MNGQKFYKMHGIGNDFIIFCIDNKNALTAEQVMQISHRKLGVGCDQVIVVIGSETQSVEMLVYNSDGSVGAISGNGARCVALLYHMLYHYTRLQITVCDRILEAEVLMVASDGFSGLVRVEMGGYELELLPSEKVWHTLETSGAYRVKVSNEHLIIFCKEPEACYATDFADIFSASDLGTWWPDINVTLAFVESNNSMVIRTHERGAGETAGCGSAACAAYAAARESGLILSDATIDVQSSGGVLQLQTADNDSILMSGPAAFVFSGVWREDIA